MRTSEQAGPYTGPGYSCAGVDWVLSLSMFIFLSIVQFKCEAFAHAFVNIHLCIYLGPHHSH